MSSDTYPPRFDELYCISDLHLGGRKGFQIFDQSPLLVALIEYLAARPSKKNVVLVVNGDTVDFLAEDAPAYFDAEGSPRKLARIFQDPAFSPLWEALSRFVNTPNRWLAITLGNHDLELALPEVRQLLSGTLSGGSDEARSRILLCFEGTGFLCRVGGATVLCLHGNEVDPWNATDHERLRRISRDLNRGYPFEPWAPNAGTKLVIDIMNQVKRTWPIVDLLKPEAQAAIPVLVSLDPSQLQQVARIAPVLLKLAGDTTLRRRNLLSVEEALPLLGADDEISEEAALDHLLAPAFSPGSSRTVPGSDGLLREAMGRIERGEDALASARRQGGAQTLGTLGLIWDLIRGRDADRNLREALQAWLAEDRSFDHDHADFTYRRINAKVGSSVDFLLTGHTHQVKALPRGGGGSQRGAYFNSGTWVRLIRLTEEMLADDRRFAHVLKVFRQNSLAALDSAPDLVIRHPAVVAIRERGGRSHGELRLAGIDDSRTFGLQPIAGTQHSVG